MTLVNANELAPLINDVKQLGEQIHTLDLDLDSREKEISMCKARLSGMSALEKLEDFKKDLQG